MPPLSTSDRLRDALSALTRALLLPALAICLALASPAVAQDDDADQSGEPPPGVRHVVRHHVDGPAEGDSAKPEAPPQAEPTPPPSPSKASVHPKKRAASKKPAKHKAKPARKHSKGSGPPV